MRKEVVISLVIVMSLMLMQITHAQDIERYSTPVRAPLPSPSGDFVVAVVDEYGIVRGEAYLGDYLYVIFDLTKFTGKVRVKVYFDYTLVAEGTVDGGYWYAYGFRTVEPIFEGKVYTVRVEVYSLGGVLLGSGTYSYVEKYCPDADIVDVKWSPFIHKQTSSVTVRVRNRGERGEAYRVVVYSQSGALRETSGSVSVGSGSTGEVTLAVPVDKYVSSDVMYVKVLCAGGRKEAAVRTFPISVVPQRPGPFTASISTVELRLGVEGVFSITVTNKGYAADIVDLSLSEGRYTVDKPSQVGEGGSATFTIRLTPERAGVYEIKAVLRYKSPATGEVYEDVFTIPVKVYAKLAVELRDHTGQLLDAVPVIDGVAARERWLLPGTYTVEVPQVVNVAPDVRAVFERWEGAAGGTRATVSLEKNTVVKALYSRQYRVVAYLAPAGNNLEAWVREGDVYTLPVDKYVSVERGVRWALRDVRVNGVSQGVNTQFRVVQPTEVRTVWAREYLLVVDCGDVKCVGGESRVERWVEEGGSLSVSLEQYVPAGGRERWRLDGDAKMSIKADGPREIKPRYVRQYLLKLGYVVRDASGEVERRVVKEEWVDAGVQYSVDANSLRPVGGEGVSYRQSAVLLDGKPSSASFTVAAPHDVYVVWDKYYLVEVYTPIGTASGAGWYLAGSYATVSIDQPVRGFLVLDKFEGWRDQNGNMYRNATVTLRVDQPIRLTAVWSKDYTQVAAVAAVGGAVGFFGWIKRDALESMWYRLESTVTRTRSSDRKRKRKNIDIEKVE